MQEKEIGKFTHYFAHVSAGIIELSDALKVGDKIHVKGHTSDFTQDILSMQIDRVPAQEAKAGDLISIKVEQKVRKDDAVYKVA